MLVVWAVTGCGGGEDIGPTGTVTGTVKFQGTPVTGGMVTFSKPGEQGAGQIGADGKYSIAWRGTDQVPVGQYGISIYPPSSGDSTTSNPNFPEKYYDATTSGLTGEVKEGPNTIDLDMQP